MLVGFRTIATKLPRTLATLGLVAEGPYYVAGFAIYRGAYCIELCRGENK